METMGALEVKYDVPLAAARSCADDLRAVLLAREEELTAVARAAVEAAARAVEAKLVALASAYAAHRAVESLDVASAAASGFSVVEAFENEARRMPLSAGSPQVYAALVKESAYALAAARSCAGKEVGNAD